MKSTHLDEYGRPVMVDVSGKNKTLREAEAEALVRLTPAIAESIKNGSVPKGDVFRIAETAGIMAVKHTPQLIPLCHVISLDHAKVECELEGLTVTIHCVVKSNDATGVEMEAMTGASVAALTVYDMCKGMDKGIIIDGVRLLRKSGGKSGDYAAATRRDETHRHEEHNEAPARIIRAGVLTVSDKGARGERIDTSGPALAEMLKDFSAEVIKTAIVPDEKDLIAERLMSWADADGLELILTTGGTGLSPRDVTPEALMSIADRTVPGIGECMRSCSFNSVPTAILSRGLAVTRGGTLIIALPGSRRGAGECFDFVRPALRHALDILNQVSSECGRP